MKFAAIALMAVVMLTSDVEAHPYDDSKSYDDSRKYAATAKCRIVAGEEEGGVEGMFTLREMNESISIKGKLFNTPKSDFSMQLFTDDICSGDADGDAFRVRKSGGRKKKEQDIRIKARLQDEELEYL